MGLKQREFKEELARILRDVRSSKLESRSKERSLEAEVAQLKRKLAGKESLLKGLRAELKSKGLLDDYQRALDERRGTPKKPPDEIPSAPVKTGKTIAQPPMDPAGPAASIGSATRFPTHIPPRSGATETAEPPDLPTDGETPRG